MSHLERLLNDPTPRRLRQWLTELPLADINALSDQLTATLEGLEQVALAPTSRLQVLEAAIQPLRLAVDDFTRRLASQPFPLPAGAQALANRSSRLIQATLDGYRRVGNTGQSWIGRRLGLDLAQLAAQRQLMLYSTCITQHRLVGRPLPAGTWRTVHGIYHSIQGRRRAQARIDGPGPLRRPTSVAETYAELLLAALLPVQQLTHAELDQLLPTLSHWAGLLRLTRGGKASGWYVDPEGDAPPLPASLVAPEDKGKLPGLLRLDSQRIATALKKNCSETGVLVRTGANRTTLPLPLARTLDESWCRPPTRRHERKAASRDSVAIVGLGALNYLLAPGDLSELPAAESTQERLSLAAAPAVRRQGEPLAERERQSQDIWDSIYFDKTVALPPSTPNTVRQWNTVERNRVYHPLAVHLEDISARGLCLRVEDAGGLAVRGGDLIGIRSHRDHWHAGIIRWIQGDEERLRIGVRLIAYDCEPLAIIATSPDRPPVRLPAVLGRLRDHRPVLAVPKLPSQARHNLSVTVNGRSHPLHVLQLRIDSPYFQLFRINPLPADAGAAPAKTHS